MKIYKSILFIAFFALLACLSACNKTANNKEASKRLLTSATGSIYECLVVMDSHPLTQNQLNAIASMGLENKASGYSEPISNTYDLVKAVMAEDMPCMPQMEPYFRITNVKNAAFDDMFKATRNILIIDINPQKYTQLKAKISTDYWSTPQAVYRIQAPSQDAFVEYWLENGKNIREWFVQQEIKRQTKFYQASTNKQARSILQQQGYDMLIPEDYMLVMDTLLSDNVKLLWCCNNKGPMRRDVIVYHYPYTNPNTFSSNFLNERRDAVLSQVITGSLEGSYMGTEYKVMPPQQRQICVNDSTLAYEIRGLWRILQGEAMGGPYVSHTRLDHVNARVVTAEVFLYAAGQKKRTALRQAEAILYTLQLPEDNIK